MASYTFRRRDTSILALGVHTINMGKQQLTRKRLLNILALSQFLEYQLLSPGAYIVPFVQKNSTVVTPV